MTYSNRKNIRLMERVYKKKFNLWKFKMEMVLALIDLWDIVDGFGKAPSSNTDPKVLKKYQRCVNKAISIINSDLANNQLTHIKSCKGLAKAWKTLCNIYQMKSLSNILFNCRKFFTYNIKKTTTYWTTLIRLKCSLIGLRFWRSPCGWKTFSWHSLKVCGRYMKT